MHKRKQSHGVLPLDDGTYDVSMRASSSNRLGAAGTLSSPCCPIDTTPPFPIPHTYVRSIMRWTTPGRTT